MWNQTRGFMSRMRRNVAGNTIAMAAAALIPLIAAVGGAVDISRFYMATSRLQAACDSGALAARKKMGENIWEESDRLHGLTFFDQNFPDGLFGLKDLSRNYAADGQGTVTGTATGALPTTLMQIFNFGQLDLSVTCSAEINISNTDIMFVLDVTGSMNCPEDGSACPGGNNNNVESATARIKGLRTATLSFYDAVETATSGTAQVRYGIVPYASNVNVGKLIPPAYMATRGTYQSRVANINTVTDWVRQPDEITNIQRTGDLESQNLDFTWVRTNNEAACTARRPADETIVTSALGLHQGAISQTVVGDIRRTSFRDDNEDIRFRRGFTFYRSDGWCAFGWENFTGKADVFFDVVERRETRQVFASWTYRPVEFTLTDLYDDDTITLPTGTSGANQNHTWDGCIIEADSVNTATWFPLPAAAHDLNINLIPSDNAQRWKPQLPDLTYNRRNGGTRTRNNVTTNDAQALPQYDCPKEALRLADISRAQLASYVNSIAPRSSTYHDLGMIWGARFISPRGIFTADNAAAPNGDAIGRHIVYMTDGEILTSAERLTPYGVEWWDRKVTNDAANTTADARHAARFQAACRQARQENISVWVVAFGIALDQNLIDCATPGRAYHASNSAELQTRFQEIAERIAALRLTQ